MADSRGGRLRLRLRRVRIRRAVWIPRALFQCSAIREQIGVNPAARRSGRGSRASSAFRTHSLFHPEREGLFHPEREGRSEAEPQQRASCLFHDHPEERLSTYGSAVWVQGNDAHYMDGDGQSHRVPLADVDPAATRELNQTHHLSLRLPPPGSAEARAWED